VRWTLVGLGCVLVLAIAVVAIGALLPKAHVAMRRAAYRQTPEVLFSILTNFSAAPSWRSSLKRVDILAPREGKPSFRETGRNGTLTFVVDELAAPHRLVTRIVDNSSFGGTWTYEISSDASGCLLAITERGEVYNPLFRFMGRFFFSQTATLEAYLADLSRKLGEAP
jgi:hypothetical protein